MYFLRCSINIWMSNVIEEQKMGTMLSNTQISIYVLQYMIFFKGMLTFWRQFKGLSKFYWFCYQNSNLQGVYCWIIYIMPNYEQASIIWLHRKNWEFTDWNAECQKLLRSPIMGLRLNYILRRLSESFIQIGSAMFGATFSFVTHVGLT